MPRPRTRSASDPVPRKQPTQPRAAATVDAIVEAVERVLERDGVDALNTNRVAEIAGVSIGTLYQYFPNKESLVAEVHGRYLAHTLRILRTVLAAADGVPLVIVVERIGAAMVAAAGAQREIHRWLYDLRAAAGFQDAYRASIDAITADVEAFLARRTDVRFPDTRAAAFVLAHAINGIIAATAERRTIVQVDVAQVAAAAVAMVAAYVAANGAA